MLRVLATDGIEKSAAMKLQENGFEVLEKYFEPQELAEQIKNVDAVIVRSATKVRKPIIDAALETGRLKLIIRGGVGVDNIDVSYAQEKGIKVANTPNASSASVAELAIAHMFSLARFIGISNVTMKQGQWNKKQYEGIELAGKTLGLIGFGRIAQEVAKRAVALGMQVIYTTRSGAKQGFPDNWHVSMDELLENADFISLHIPYEKGMQPVLGAKEFAKMQDGVFIINTARGGVFEEQMLLAALESGKVAGAALDVFEEEPTKNESLYAHPRVSVTPHIGGSTKEGQSRIGEEIFDIVIKYFS